MAADQTQPLLQSLCMVVECEVAVLSMITVYVHCVLVVILKGVATVA